MGHQVENGTSQGLDLNFRFSSLGLFTNLKFSRGISGPKTLWRWRESDRSPSIPFHWGYGGVAEARSWTPIPTTCWPS